MNPIDPNEARAEVLTAALLMIVLALFMFGGLGNNFAMLAAGVVVAAARLEPQAVSEPAGDVWAQWSPAAVAEARGAGRPVFVDFTAAWCVTCQVNKLGALSDGAVRSAFAAHDVALLRADFTNRDPDIAAELERHGAAGVPLYLIYPGDGGAPEVLPPILTSARVIQAVEQAVD